MSQKNIAISVKSQGFTLIEIMLVMAIAAVMMTMKMQDDKLEMTQLQARKLGATELFVYNLGVQKYLSGISGVQATVGEYPKFYTGTNWLKDSSICIDPGATADKNYVPCSFLSGSNGKTVFGSMSFTTTIDYDYTSGSGYSARTVLSPMSGTAAGETNSGVLGLAALVASGAFIGSNASATGGGSTGSITYCPDITPMPPGMGVICGAERDQIVMFVNTNGANDTWLRVDHGNMMAHAIEFQGTSTTPANDIDMGAEHPNMRQIRNVARIYNATLNATSDPENLYIGNREGADLLDSSNIFYPSLTESAVIIDADQEIVGRLVVQNGITVNNGGVLVENGDATISSGDLKVSSGNADINGWIKAGETITANGDVISTTGDIVAKSGDVRSKSFIDSDNTDYIMDPFGESVINDIKVNKVRNNPLLSTSLDFRSGEIDIRAIDGDTVATKMSGYIDASDLYVKKNTAMYKFEDLIPDLTFVGSYIAASGDGTSSIFAPDIWARCGGSANTRVFIVPLQDNISTENRLDTTTGIMQRSGVGNQVRWVERSGNFYKYFAQGAFNHDYDGSVYDVHAKAILQFYCHRP